jgi:cell division septation protein DedD
MAQAKPKKGSEKPAEMAADEDAHAVVLHLSSLRSEDAAKREWTDLQHNYPRPLAEMTAEIRRTELGGKGTFYRVLAGPLPSRDKAKQVCAELKAKDAKQYCRILPSKPKAS